MITASSMLAQAKASHQAKTVFTASSVLPVSGDYESYVTTRGEDWSSPTQPKRFLPPGAVCLGLGLWISRQIGRLLRPKVCPAGTGPACTVGCIPSHTTSPCIQTTPSTQQLRVREQPRSQDTYCRTGCRVDGTRLLTLGEEVGWIGRPFCM
jgi:hypothetical protein